MALCLFWKILNVQNVQCKTVNAKSVEIEIIPAIAGSVLRDDGQPGRRDQPQDQRGRLHDQRMQRSHQVRSAACDFKTQKQFPY